VFCKKSVDLLDNKGVEFFIGYKESVTDSCGTTYVVCTLQECGRRLNAFAGGRLALRTVRGDED